MKDSLLKRIELVANVCIIVVALVICAAVAKRLLLKSPSSVSGTQAIAAGSRSQDQSRRNRFCEEWSNIVAGALHRLQILFGQCALLPKSGNQNRIDSWYETDCPATPRA